MDLQKMATQMVKEKLLGGSSNSSNSDESAIGNALSGLFGGGKDGDLDIGGLVAKLSGGSLGGALQSWLGDGDNDSISADDVKSTLGTDKIGAFAKQLGIGEEDAAGGLSDLIPDLIDKNSSGGDLMGALSGLAGKLFK